MIRMEWFQIIIAAIAGIAASSGFWTYVQNKHNKASADRAMLLGLGHDKIEYLCLKYINRGWLTTDEYENLYTYLYAPYRNLGGNGAVERLMQEVNKLEVRAVTLQEAAELR